MGLHFIKIKWLLKINFSEYNQGIWCVENNRLRATRDFSFSFDPLEGIIIICDGGGTKSACTYSYIRLSKNKFLYALLMEKGRLLKDFEQFFHFGDRLDDERVFSSGETFHPKIRRLFESEDARNDKKLASSIRLEECHVIVAENLDGPNLPPEFSQLSLSDSQKKVLAWTLAVNDLMSSYAQILMISGHVVESTKGKEILENHAQASASLKNTMHRKYKLGL